MQKLLVVPAAVCKLDCIVELSVVGNKICELPAELGKCWRMRVLNAGANELCGLPPLNGTTLVHVGMSCNMVADDCLEGIVESLPPSVQSIDLSTNELCSRAEALKTLSTVPNLKQLALKRNPCCAKVRARTAHGHARARERRKARAKAAPTLSPIRAVGARQPGYKDAVYALLGRRLNGLDGEPIPKAVATATAPAEAEEAAAADDEGEEGATGGEGEEGSAPAPSQADPHEYVTVQISLVSLEGVSAEREQFGESAGHGERRRRRTHGRSLCTRL
eukprot:3353697-Prymnesium_polylepis.1